MTLTRAFRLSIVLLLATASIGVVVGPAGASESGPTFQIELFLEDGTTKIADNCYTFNSDGSWEDPLFLNSDGTTVDSLAWTGDRRGNDMRYVSTGVNDLGVTLVQSGRISPRPRANVLELQAQTVVGYPDGTSIDLVSVGQRIADPANCVIGFLPGVLP
jgi:hypothetical protein